MTDYAQIPTSLICRFGELSKTEIRVLCFLYTSRNRKTGRCNPSRAYIARYAGLSRTHVTPAINSLVGKGWIAETDEEGFHLFSEPENVTDSVTTEEPVIGIPVSELCYENGNTSVTESVTVSEVDVTESVQIVTESVTECYGIGNTQYKDSSEQKIEQKEEQSKTALAVASPHTVLMRHHAQRIGTITDGAGQGDHIKKLLAKNFSVADCIGCYNYEVLELDTEPGGWRSSVSWKTVSGFISEWITKGRPERPVKTNGKHQGNGKSNIGALQQSADYFERKYGASAPDHSG